MKMFHLRSFWWKREQKSTNPRKLFIWKLALYWVFYFSKQHDSVGLHVLEFPWEFSQGNIKFSCLIFCHLCPFSLIIFAYKTCETNLVCFFFVLALEYPNLDISETTRDYWVITGNLLFYSFLSPIRLVFFFFKLHVRRRHQNFKNSNYYSYNN